MKHETQKFIQIVAFLIRALGGGGETKFNDNIRRRR